MSDPVLDLITKNGLQYSVSGRDYLIKCLNPDHDDSNPSFRVDRVSGVAHCFSCGFKTNLFKYYGVFTNLVPIKIAKLKDKLADIKRSQIGLELPRGATPYTRAFRGISAKTLKEFNAFYTTDPKLEQLHDRICFPVYDIRNKYQVFVCRHTLSSGNPRYINYPNAVQMPVFPPSAPAGSKSLVLVEGITDFLNLYDKGLTNTACTFGTNTLQNDIKLKMLPFRAQGVTHIYILFDGDAPGRKAADILKPQLEALEFIVEIITLEDDQDPGGLSQDYVDSIREYVNK